VTDDLVPCACGRPFVPDVAMYHGHVQTPEHQRWRFEVVGVGRPMSDREKVEMMPTGPRYAPKAAA
jgi:hypothetical protein